MVVMATRHIKNAIYRQTSCAALSQKNKTKKLEGLAEGIPSLVSLQPLV